MANQRDEKARPIANRVTVFRTTRTVDGDPAAPKAWLKASYPWGIGPFNHNFLRITRILLCLKALGLPEWSAAFVRRLEAIYRRHAAVIGAKTYRFWQGAAGG